MATEYDTSFKPRSALLVSEAKDLSQQRRANTRQVHSIATYTGQEGFATVILQMTLLLR